jgi:hypothetical protein
MPTPIDPSTPAAAGGADASSGSGVSLQTAAAAVVSFNEFVTVPGSNITFDNAHAASVTQAYYNDIVAAETAIATEWTAPSAVTLYEAFGAAAEGQNGTLAGNNPWLDQIPYSYLKSALGVLAKQEPNNTYLQQAVANLPQSDPTNGVGFVLPTNYSQMLGLDSLASSFSPDTVTLNTSYSWNYGQDVIDTLEHEITEGGMGRLGGLGDLGGQNHDWSTMDLFRYNASGQPDYKDGRDGKATYFS